MAQTSVDTSSAASFTKFGQLPPEIRIKIWQYSLPAARLISVRSPFRNSETTTECSAPTSLADLLSSCFELDNTPTPQITWRSDAKPPALLHVNAEARHEALKTYKLSLGANGCEPQIYVDFERDTLFFGDAELESKCTRLWSSTPDLKLARRLAIVPEGAWRVLRWWRGVGDADSLKELVFVHGSEGLDFSLPLPELEEDSFSSCDEDEHEDISDVDQEDSSWPATPATEIDEDEAAGSTIIFSLPDGQKEITCKSIQVDEKSQTVSIIKTQPVSVVSEISSSSLSPSSSSSKRPSTSRRSSLSKEDALALKRRQDDAKAELATLMMALPSLWSVEPRVSTATFKSAATAAAKSLMAAA